MITVVSGMTRCGSSLILRCLHHGGMAIYADNTTSYEHEDMLTLPQHTAWLQHCEGKAVKILDPHQYRLPCGYQYRTILLTRNPDEQAKSLVKFARMMTGTSLPDAAIATVAQSLRADLPVVRTLLARLGTVLEVAFETLVTNPAPVLERVCTFLADVPLDLRAMEACVFRRNPACYPGLLEAQELEGKTR